MVRTWDVNILKLLHVTSLHTFVCAIPSFPSVLWFLSIVVLFDFFEISFHQITQSSSEPYFAFPTLKKRIPQYFDRVIPSFTINFFISYEVVCHVYCNLLFGFTGSVYVKNYRHLTLNTCI